MKKILLSAMMMFSLSGCCTLMGPDEPVRYSKANKEMNAVYHFAFDSAVLSHEDMPLLDNFAQHLTQNPTLKAHVDGFTDHQGPHNYNLELGLARAQSVADYLASKGIAPQRIVIQSYGADKLVDETKTLAANAKNRRAVIYTENA